MATFQIYTFETPLSQGYGGRIAQLINQYFAINPTISVVDVRFSFRRNERRAQRLVHLIINTTPTGQTAQDFPGGTRFYSVEFLDTPGGMTAYQKAQQFFISNPTFRPIFLRSIPPDDDGQSYLFRHQMICVYLAENNLFSACIAQSFAGRPQGTLPPGGVQRTRVVGALAAPAPLMLNAGGAAWPVGAPAPAIKETDSDLLCHWAGIAPGCYATQTIAATSPPASPTFDVCASTPVPFTGSTTDTTTPPASTTYTATTPPPPGDCCLQATWNCEYLLGASTWVLDEASVDCVPNADCGADQTAICTEP